MDEGTKPTIRQKPLEGLPTYIGRVLAERYKIVKKLGEGGMGAVYLAEHVLIEKKVAIKILTVERSQEYLSRFAQEAKAASRIGHENIIDITDFGDTGDGAVFLCMEYLDGLDLGRTIRTSGPQSIERCVRVLQQVCSALEAAHAKGIIHRDLKPDNIFIVPRSGRPDFVKILDFGLARVTDVPAGQRLTQHGQILGTPEYMSPEQVRGDAVDGRTDVYAAGMVLYEMLTGDVPFKGAPYPVILSKQLQVEPDPPSKVNTTITREIDAVVLKALQKKVEDRHQTMTELAEAFAAATGTRTIPKTLSAPKMTKHAAPKWGWAVLAAGVLLVLGGLYWISRPPPPQVEPPPKIEAPPPPKVQAPPILPAVVPSPVAKIRKKRPPKPAEPKKKSNELKDVFSDE